VDVAAQLRTRRHVPQAGGAIGARREQEAAVGREDQVVDPAGVAEKLSDLAPGAVLPELDHAVEDADRKLLAVRRRGQAPEPLAGNRCELADQLARIHIPDADDAVLGRPRVYGDDGRVVRHEDSVRHLFVELPDEIARRDLPDRRGIRAACHDVALIVADVKADLGEREDILGDA
jgi:hypothetical protein